MSFGFGVLAVCIVLIVIGYALQQRELARIDRELEQIDREFRDLHRRRIG